MIKPKYIVSACLAGENCRYDGGNNYIERIASLVKDGSGILVCPEVMGGLPIPRVPCEICQNKVFNKDNADKTIEFEKGAEEALELASRFGIYKAILKANSPSCGKDKVYDGTFSGVIVNGQGITAKLLEDNGFVIYSEEDLPTYDAIVVAAGSGTRTGLEYNKMFYHSGVKTVIEAAVEPFVSDYLCNKVIVVCNKDEQELCEALLGYSKVIFVHGGKCREESVYNGLQQVNSEHVLIHDGARANITDQLIHKVSHNLEHGYECVIPYIKPDNDVDYQVDGKSIQTPQGFNTTSIKKAFEQVKNKLDSYRDESSIAKDAKLELTYLEGDITNFKITTKDDLERWKNLHLEDE